MTVYWPEVSKSYPSHTLRSFWRLRAAGEIASTPVIFCTVHFKETDDWGFAREFGVMHVLTKPWEPETVLRTAESSLRNRAE